MNLIEQKKPYALIRQDDASCVYGWFPSMKAAREFATTNGIENWYVAKIILESARQLTEEEKEFYS